MRTRKLLLDLHDLLTAGLRDYPFPVPCVYGAAMEGGQPRSASEAFSAQNASESECCTGCAAERHLHDVRVFLHGLPEELGEGCYPFVVIRWAEGRRKTRRRRRWRMKPWGSCWASTRPRIRNRPAF